MKEKKIVNKTEEDIYESDDGSEFSFRGEASLHESEVIENQNKKAQKKRFLINESLEGVEYTVSDETELKMVNDYFRLIGEDQINVNEYPQTIYGIYLHDKVIAWPEENAKEGIKRLIEYVEDNNNER